MAKIFIPFLDKILNYDCKECGYDCCRGGNIIMDAKEKRKLLAHYPFLRYFFTQQTKKIYGLRKFPRCWFLERSGLCYIQKKFGYSFKPLICKLHPFSVAQCNKEYIVLVDYCPALCVGADRKNKTATHEMVLKNAQAVINNDFILRKIDWSQKRLDLEKKILKGSRMFLNNPDYLNFAAFQVTMATQDNDITKIKAELTGSVNLWKSFLEIDKLNLKARKLTYELTALTPLLRLENYYLSRMQERKVPLALLALYFYMLLFLQKRKTKIYLETYTQILNDIALGLLYLTKDDLVMKHKTTEEKILYLRKVKDLHNYKYREIDKID